MLNIITIAGIILTVTGIVAIVWLATSKDIKNGPLDYLAVLLCALAITWVGVALIYEGHYNLPITGKSSKTEEHLGHFIDEQGKIHDEYLHPYTDGSMGFTGFTDDGYPTSVVAPAGTWFLEVDEDRMEDPSVVITTTEMVKKHSGEHVATAISFTFHIGEGGNIIAEEDPVLPTKAGN